MVESLCSTLQDTWCTQLDGSKICYVHIYSASIEKSAWVYCLAYKDIVNPSQASGLPMDSSIVIDSH
ncbi:hypothetical protein RO3G_02796 [Rhizopus delemar RA 99-880]|uniref:Uncharacterized protein n=1 Tax=Rhizopus delemar (strain RA 99-880 / ATCC MYA-4621 / FGSC 9543 / NRRL 43880) TaxID=246409 RepID=I1BPG2_RHIO9|nr:hypothetical protein RO3G_02796 [Rhizopus delemar RA 99-880]|eukprot:EIE78092.1 hypothetical protein RO3G_02796 [Rhizopus delemar RA 99-880]